MTRPDKWRHTPESRAKIAAAHHAQWDNPAKRAAVGEATKARLADPAVRQHIEDGMRDGIAQANELRARFIIELLSPVSFASALEMSRRWWRDGSSASPKHWRWARTLRNIGVFEERTCSGDITFWAPFVYRRYLSLSQGKVDEISAAELTLNKQV